MSLVRFRLRPPLEKPRIPKGIRFFLWIGVFLFCHGNIPGRRHKRRKDVCRFVSGFQRDKRVWRNIRESAGQRRGRAESDMAHPEKGWRKISVSQRRQTFGSGENFTRKKSGSNPGNANRRDFRGRRFVKTRPDLDRVSDC